MFFFIFFSSFLLKANQYNSLKMVSGLESFKSESKKKKEMSLAEQASYTLINVPTDAEPPSELQLRQELEKGDVKMKINALKKTIQLILNGEKMPSLLMIIIRFVMPLHDHTIKKLLLIFWEVVPKCHADGKLLQEMILVCDAYRKDLQHPNEFIRGSTLRFLCKLKEPELLEPLMPAIRQCLEHRHSYVRRNAVLAIYTIFRNHDFLIPDAPELIAKFLEEEHDMSCRRNAFMMLIHADQEAALNYLSSCIDQVNSFGDILQLVIVELIYKVCHANPSERARFIRCIYNLLNSSSPAVRYEAAGTLVTLSSAPTAVKLMEFLGDQNELAAADVLVFVHVHAPAGAMQKLVTADGTYASQSAFSTITQTKKEERPPLRQYLMNGDFFAGAALATDLTKLALRYIQLTDDVKKQNKFVADSMLIMSTIIHLGKSGLPSKPITDDDVDRIAICLRVLADKAPLMSEIFNAQCRESLSVMLAAKVEEEKAQMKAAEKKSVKIQADHPISFTQLTSRNELGTTENMFELTLSQALGTTGKKEADSATSSKLNKVTQLTGFSDPVYAEAYVNVNQYDIVLDVLVVNQTADTLQNLTLELANQK
ncbi:COPB1 [Acanthosepion pharaonis]|uniref:Coatomer subunit beta n=1 Tax=Acanthosepion pharaonis TaxID=158019 RepID=A0A812CX92_ACAPH|nr:COPB1 [Sepia pharaonis]